MKSNYQQKKLARDYKMLGTKLGIDIFISLVVRLALQNVTLAVFHRNLFNQKQRIQPENGTRNV